MNRRTFFVALFALPMAVIYPKPRAGMCIWSMIPWTKIGERTGVTELLQGKTARCLWQQHDPKHGVDFVVRTFRITPSKTWERVRLFGPELLRVK